MSSTLILMYHRIGGGILADRQPGEHLYAVEPATFRRQLEAIRAGHAPVVGVEALAGSVPPADRALALTFDDGNRSDYHQVLPALAALGLTAAFFVSPALVGQPGYVTWAELAEMAAKGMTIGGHGFDHTPLASLDDGALAAQMQESQRLFRAHLGAPARTLSLPNGSGGEREVRAARAAGFEIVLGSQPGTRPAGPLGDPWPRIAVRRGDSLEQFTALVERRRVALWRQTARHRILTLARKGLGERIYQRARRALGAEAGR